MFYKMSKLGDHHIIFSIFEFILRVVKHENIAT
jgi:hypothetical protein